jgi:cytochrome c-type biogenesis protein CcmH
MRRAALALLFLIVLAGPAGAVNPDERLGDPAMEARARGITQGLRCLVCQNESIDDSNADLARDLRILVRQRLTAGDTDEQAMEYVHQRYGDFVLLKPPVKPYTYLLWFGPAALLVGGGAVSFLALRRRSATLAKPQPLSEQELNRLAELTRPDGGA